MVIRSSASNKAHRDLLFTRGFQIGSIDNDELITELRSKADCSENGVMVDSMDLVEVLKRFENTRMVLPGIEASSNPLVHPLGVRTAPEEHEYSFNANEADDTIECICGFPDDDGNTVLCETCNTWQHIVCYWRSAEKVPDVHECVNCSPRPVDTVFAKETQRRRKNLEMHSTPGFPHTAYHKGTDTVINPPMGSYRADLEASPTRNPHYTNVDESRVTKSMIRNAQTPNLS